MSTENVQRIDDEPKSLMWWRIAQGLALLQFVKAMELYEAYVIQLGYLTSGHPTMPLDWTVAFGSLLFVSLPVAAVIGLLRQRSWGFIPLAIFPLLATLYGAVPIPFVHHLYSPDIAFMSKLILVINIFFAALGLLLRRKAVQSNLSNEALS